MLNIILKHILLVLAILGCVFSWIRFRTRTQDKKSNPDPDKRTRIRNTALFGNYFKNLLFLFSAVPSEYSDISTNSSSDGGEIADKTVVERPPFGDKKTLTPFRVDARPLIVGQGGKTATVGPISTELSEDSGNGSGGGGSSSSCGEESGVGGDVKRPDKAYLIANELLTTEIHYVSRLHLIDQVCERYIMLLQIYMLNRGSRFSQIENLHIAAVAFEHSETSFLDLILVIF